MIKTNYFGCFKVSAYALHQFLPEHKHRLPPQLTKLDMMLLMVQLPATKPSAQSELLHRCGALACRMTLQTHMLHALTRMRLQAIRGCQKGHQVSISILSQA